MILNDAVASITGAIGIAAGVVAVGARFGAEAATEESHQHHEAPCCSQPLCPTQVFAHDIQLATPC